MKNAKFTFGEEFECYDEAAFSEAAKHNVQIKERKSDGIAYFVGEEQDVKAFMSSLLDIEEQDDFLEEWEAGAYKLENF